jgi:predicted RNA-binding Zn ribbon-like protein
MLKIESAIDQDYLLASLNGARAFGEERRAATEAPNHAVQMKDGSWSGLLPAPDRDYEEAGRMFIAELRELVDQWLASGRDEGVDEPPRRNLRRALAAQRALEGWAMHQQTRIIPWISGEWIVTVGWAESSLTGRDSPKTAAIDEARRLFAMLMWSTTKQALFKCDHPGCGQYYFLERPRKLYKRGTFCSQHVNRASATRGTIKAREDEQERLLEVAAGAFMEWSGLPTRIQKRHGHVKAYIAAKVFHLGKGVKWVTRHISKIEQFASELKPA